MSAGDPMKPVNPRREAHLRRLPVGRVFTAPFDVILSNVDVVEPDLLFLTNARMAQVATAPWVRGAPSLVRRDRTPIDPESDATIKRVGCTNGSASTNTGLSIPELDAIDAYQLVEGRYQRTAPLTLETTDVLTRPLLPGLTLPFSTIFED